MNSIFTNIIEQGNITHIRDVVRPMSLPLLQLEQLACIFHEEPLIISLRESENGDAYDGVLEFFYSIHDLNKSESWKIYQIPGDSGQLIGRLIRHTFWNEENDRQILHQRRQRLLCTEVPNIVSTNTFLPISQVESHQRYECLLGESVPFISEFIQQEQPYFHIKTLKVVCGGIGRTVSWEHPYISPNAELWLKAMIALLEEISLQPYAEAYELLLDYRCQIADYWKNIIGTDIK